MYGNEPGRITCRNRSRSVAPMARADRCQIGLTAFTPFQVLMITTKQDEVPTSMIVGRSPSPNHMTNSGA